MHLLILHLYAELEVLSSNCGELSGRRAFEINKCINNGWQKGILVGYDTNLFTNHEINQNFRNTHKNI